MKTLNEIQPIKQDIEKDFLSRPGVTGVGIAKKIKGGKITDELSIRVYVEEKKDVPKDEMIPKTIKGIKTDVIERKFVLHPFLVRVEDIELKADTSTYDPLQGGISIGPCRSVYLNDAEAACQGAPGAGNYIFVGTLGAIVRDNNSGDEMLLSNFHVMCLDNGWNVGDDMVQPSRVDGGSCPADIVGELQRASLGGQVDCAVASHTDRGYSCEIVDIGDVTGTATASVGMAVRKRGRTTGLTYGTVDDVNLSVTIDYCNGLGNVTLTNQIGIDVETAKSTQFGNSGDSGSVVVDKNRKVIGLYFAGTPDGTYGVANPIQAVLNTLDVKICVPKSKEILKEFKDLKEYREEFKYLKEYKEKEKEKEFKEYKDFKEYKEKDFKEKDKDIYEGYPPNMPPTQPLPTVPRGSFEERLSRLETLFEKFSHFIGAESRPDLSTSPLSQEKWQSSSNMGELNQRLQKQAGEAKQAKDNKELSEQ